MAKGPPISHELKVAAAAMLAAQGLAQDAIGRRLNVSQASVSRLLREAEYERHWLKRSPVFCTDRVPPEILQAARGAIFEHNLVAEFRRALGQVQLREVLVFDSGGTGTSEDDLRARMTMFGRAAATRVLELLEKVDRAGVSWGRTLLHVIRGLADVCLDMPRAARPIEFVPLCCEPLGNVNVDASSSRLARQLNSIVNDSQGPLYSFTGVPAFIPKGFTKQERAAIEKLNRAVASYAKVFPPVHSKPRGTNRSADTYLVDGLELILTSLAPAERLLGYSENDHLEATGFSREELQSLAIGDICGILIERQGLSPTKKGKITECNNCCTGVSLKQLQQVPAETKTGHPGGVVVMAIGASKAPIVIEAVKLGVHELLIDIDLAETLCLMLRQEQPPP